MKRTVTTMWIALALAGATFGQARLNRLQLDNGGETLNFLNDPYIGSDPENGNFSGDLYWKVYPRQSVQRAAGASTLWGTEQNLFDLDWGTDSTIWAYAIVESFVGTDNSIRPVLSTTAAGVLVPEVPSVFPPPAGDCFKPGYVSGWIFSDLFVDTATGSFIPLMQATDPGAPDYFRSDGTVDWSFVHFFPGAESLTSPSPNSCGSGFAGDASFMWFASTDERQGPATFAPNQSRYGGFQDGSVGTLTPEIQARGAELAFFVSGSPTQNLRVNTQYDPCLPEIGLAGLEPPIGWSTDAGAPAMKDCDIFPGSMPVTLGTRNYDSESTTGMTFGAHAANIDTPGGSADLLIDIATCVPLLGADFCMNPTNSIFGATFNASLNPPTTYAAATPPGGNDDSPEWNSPQYPLPPDPCLLGVTIGWQGFSIEPVSLSMRGTQVSRQTLRDNSNL